VLVAKIMPKLRPLLCSKKIERGNVGKKTTSKKSLTMKAAPSHSKQIYSIIARDVMIYGFVIFINAAD
jgi:hypothetical protein